MPASMPASDLSDAPDEWLQARIVLLDENDDRTDKFAREIEAIYKLREIEQHEGRHWHGNFEETKAELIRRGLREPDPEPEFMSRSATVAAIKEKFGCELYRARWWANLLPAYAEDGGKWKISNDRKWYRITEVEALLSDE